MIHYEDERAIVEWDTNLKCVVMTWKKMAIGEAYRRILNKVLELFELHHPSSLISDSRLMNFMGPDDQDWVVKDWLPRAHAFGLRRVAVVTPQKELVQSSLSRLIKRGSTEEKEFFATLEEANQWVANQQAPALLHPNH